MLGQTKLIIKDPIKIFDEVIQEVRRAEGLFPEWPVNLAEGIQIITEELGESAKAANEWRWQKAEISDVRTELFQTAAMCFRQIAMIDELLERPQATGGCPHSGG